jgi:cell division protein FtsN
MFRWTALFGILLFCAVTQAAAQAQARPIDPVFVRAQALVSDGNGVAGRALIDSVIKATPPMAPLYPQALFWRASLASNAADAESDYKHIVVDYPLAPQAEDALLRLAQLELARGDRDGALAHLQRIPRDYPRSKSLARASYWTARVLFEKNDIPNACAANASALAQSDASEVELRNQIQYQGQRCPLPAAIAVANPPAASVPPTTSGPPTSSAQVANPTPSVTASSTPTSTPVSNPSATEVSPPPVAAVEKTKPESVATVTAPAPVVPAPAPPKTVVPARRTEPPASAGSGYSVQVAAYTKKSEADKLVSSLTKRGYSARVDNTPGWFKVRIGRYATEKEAEDALRKIKAKQMEGFVVRAPAR